MEFSLIFFVIFIIFVNTTCQGVLLINRRFVDGLKMICKRSRIL